MTKQKISITIDEKMLGIVENLLKDGRFRNRSHVVEFALNKFMDVEK